MVRGYEPIRQSVALFLVLVLACLASTCRGQDADAPPPHAPIGDAAGDDAPPSHPSIVDAAGDGPTETRASVADAIEAEDFIETDRNSFTFARVTPGANRLIVESSFSYINLTGQKVSFSFPEALLRYGIGDRFELRLGWNYETGRERVPGTGTVAGFFAANAEQQMYCGFKAVVTKQSDWIPGSAFFVQGHTPTGGPQSVTQLRTGYVLGWRLSNRWDFDAALRFGTDKDSEGGYRLWAPSAVLKIPLTPSERWFTHVEYFGVITQGKEADTNRHFIDVALHHLITPNVEVGAIVAFGPHSGGMNLVTNVGFGIRF